MHMYVARKNVLEIREITLILKGKMSFATETRLELMIAGPEGGPSSDMQRYEG